MILDAKSGIRGKVIDLDTGRVVRKVIALNTDTGYIRAYRVNASGQIAEDVNGNYLTYEAVGRFRFEPIAKPTVRAVVMGAARCALCPSPLTLPGDELCVVCRAHETGQRNKMTCTRLDPLEIGHKCSKCSRDAVWAVSDEVVATPSMTGFKIERRGRQRQRVMVPVNNGGTQQWARAATVGRRYFCSRHYKPPALLDAKGEVIKELEVANRPN